MKIAIVTALAFLTLAGSAVAQDNQGGTAFHPPYLTEGDFLPRSHLERQASIQRMHLMCAADARSLCARKADGAANRCVIYHKLQLSRPCRVALEKAQQGRL
jgi:hypothetical protein